MNYMLSAVLDAEGSQSACPAASASRIWRYGAVGLPVAAESSSAPEQETVVC